MKIQIVEDDDISRKILYRILKPYGECDLAIDGVEALRAFRKASRQGQRYDLICLDIAMPRLDGQTVLKAIRRMEANSGIFGETAAKVIMTTGMSDPKNIMEAFNAQCEAYLIKPIDGDRLRKEMRGLGLLGM